jgi:hypothetical protein
MTKPDIGQAMSVTHADSPISHFGLEYFAMDLESIPPVLQAGLVTGLYPPIS